MPEPPMAATSTAAPPGTARSAHPVTAVIDTSELAARPTGRLVAPTDPAWDAARRAWNLAVDRHPAFVVCAETVDDVVATIRFAGATGLRVTPQGTGHSAAARTDLTGSILLRTDRMREVTVDPVAGTVRAGAGVLWAEVTEALAPYGLVGLAGSSGDVGVVGYTLGGGSSWFARRHGLACSSVTAVELVTGDGRFHRVDAAHEPELFWAVRGGAGNAGVVTAIEFTAYPVTQVYAGALLFPIDRAATVLPAYERWTRDLDEAATTCVRLLRIPPLPDIPEFVRGRSFVGIDGAIDLPTDRAAELLAPLRTLGPQIDTFTAMPARALGQIHMDPPQPSPAHADGLILTDLPPDAIEVLLALAGPEVESPLLAVDIRHLGGAAGRPVPGGGVVDHLPGRFAVFVVGMVPDPTAAPAVAAAVDEVTAALAPWRADRDCINFRDAPATPDRFYPPDALATLRAIQQQHDPQRVVRPNHQWSPSAGAAGVAP